MTNTRPKPRRHKGGIPLATVRKAVKKIPQYLDRMEIDALIASAPHTDCELVMMLQWRAGLRISEALAVTVADLDMLGGNIRVAAGKGNKQRLVPMHPELGAAIGTHIKFGRIRGGNLVQAKAVSTAYRWYRAARKTAVTDGLLGRERHVSTHTFRHSAARHWLENGVTINTVQIWLGHAHLQTTLIYLTLVPDPSQSMERVP